MSSPALNNQVVRVIGQKFYDFCKSHAGGRTIEAYVQYSKEHTAGEVASAVSKLLSRVFSYNHSITS